MRCTKSTNNISVSPQTTIACECIELLLQKKISPNIIVKTRHFGLTVWVACNSCSSSGTCSCERGSPHVQPRAPGHARYVWLYQMTFLDLVLGLCQACCNLLLHSVVAAAMTTTTTIPLQHAAISLCADSNFTFNVPTEVHLHRRRSATPLR
jgi:hypothetical protein